MKICVCVGKRLHVYLFSLRNKKMTFFKNKKREKEKRAKKNIVNLAHT